MACSFLVSEIDLLSTLGKRKIDKKDMAIIKSARAMKTPLAVKSITKPGFSKYLKP